jgi:putative FmdB family regulatory protein
MPRYEFYCDACKREVSLTLSVAEREAGGYRCPECGGKSLEPRIGAFFAKTSRKG